MKKINKMIASWIVLTSLVGCSSEQNSLSNENTISDTNEEIQNVATNELRLNNGEKWKVNTEMKPFIQDGTEILKMYLENDETDFKNLALDLEERNTQLIKSCTMKGEAHDELHKWLHPHIQLINKLKNSESKQEANVVIQELKQSFYTYHNYFQ